MASYQKRQQIKELQRKKIQEEIDTYNQNAFSSKTVVKVDATQKRTQINYDNPLDRFSSFVSVFTLSALTREELESVAYLKSGYRPRNVIAKTGGINGSLNLIDQSNSIFPEAQANENSESMSGDISARIVEQRQISDFAKSVLTRAHDFFIETCNITTVPVADPSRQFTSVTSIEMSVAEPYGLSLVTKLRGAANASGYKDHVTAPFLLTIEYKGYDSHGKPLVNGDNLKRAIPIHITQMQINVNQGGSQYTVNAVPVNEYAFMNRFNYTRSPINVDIKSGGKLSDYCKDITKALNEMIKIEVDQKQFGQDTADQYLVTCDPTLDDKFVIDKSSNINYTSLTPTDTNDESLTENNADEKKYNTNKQLANRLATLDKGTGISQHLVEVMKLIPPYNNDKERLRSWATKASGELGDTMDKIVSEEAKARFIMENEDKFYVNYFKVTTNLKQKNTIDPKTKQHSKIIHFHIEPIKIHILNYTQPGLHSKFRDFIAVNNRFLARKKYQYVFTGENTQILNLNLRYNVAYYSPRYKALAPQQYSTVTKPGQGTTGGLSDDTQNVEADLPNNAYPGGGKTAGTGVTGVNESLVQFQDAFSNPEGDMVKLEMEVMGDPVYLSNNQFSPLLTPNVNDLSGPGVWDNKNRSISDESYNAFDENFQSYNMNMAEPYVALDFRFPVDIDMESGTYKLNQGDRIPFSGLYRIFKIENIFERGEFKQVLHMARFRNQGIKIKDPIPDEFTKTDFGNVPVSKDRYLDEWKNIILDSDIPEGPSIRDVYNSITQKIKKFFSK
jgi:hypothetical protein